MKHNRFAQGSGVFTCRCCNRQTRATNRDHASTGNCAICFELAGIENAFSDYGAEEAYADYGAAARQYLTDLAAKGGSLDNWRDLIALLDAQEAR